MDNSEQQGRTTGSPVGTRGYGGDQRSSKSEIGVCPQILLWATLKCAEGMLAVSSHSRLSSAVSLPSCGC